VNWICELTVDETYALGSVQLMCPFCTFAAILGNCSFKGVLVCNDQWRSTPTTIFYLCLSVSGDIAFEP